MCIGLPMQVLSVRPGHALAQGRGQRREVNTALVGDCAPGDWLLVFLDSARESLSPARAAEVNATLDLVEEAMGLQPGAWTADADAVDADADAPAFAHSAAAFALPSAMSLADLARLTGSPPQPAAAAASPLAALPAHDHRHDPASAFAAVPGLATRHTTRHATACATPEDPT